MRSRWAKKPLVWHIYPQGDGAHLAKLQAFLDRFGAAPEVRALWAGWNGASPPAPLPALPAWSPACETWRAGLLAQTDLTSQLLEFAAETR